MIDTDKYEGHNLNVKPKDIQTYGHFNDEGKRDASGEEEKRSTRDINFP